MSDMPLSVGILALGCKVSQYECEAVGEAFEREGFCLRPFSEVCDIYLVNTCTVTAESDRKSRQAIRRAIKKNPDALVMVSGCYSQSAPTEVAAIESSRRFVSDERSPSELTGWRISARASR